jgi:nitrogen regulatory protein PII
MWIMGARSGKIDDGKVVVRAPDRCKHIQTGEESTSAIR